MTFVIHTFKAKKNAKKQTNLQETMKKKKMDSTGLTEFTFYNSECLVCRVPFYIAAFIVMCLEIGISQCLKFMLQFFTVYCAVIPCAVFSVQCLVLT